MARRRLACVQLRSGRDPAANLEAAEALIRAAAAAGAEHVQTPEMSNILERSRADLMAKIAPEADDLFLAGMRRLARDLAIHLHVGSIAVLRHDGAVANRAFMIAPDGAILARYDKIHMFDVDLPNGESWRESATYTAGTDAVLVDAGGLKVGLAICYDVRFPALVRAYAHAGADLIGAPAAFTRQTGEAHWHTLQRSRAIENGAYLASAAQGGRHEDGRETFGHSVIIDPWGEIIAEVDGEAPGFALAEIDTDAVAAARARIPALKNERRFGLVEGSDAARALA